MMDAFENAIFERKAGQCDGCEYSEKDDDPATVGNRRQGGDRWSSEVYDMNLDWSPDPHEGGISLCFTERGLANGWINLFGRETPLFAPFIYIMHLFTKTGSGQTQGKLKTRMAFP
jgi:hypothetical protein